MNGKVLTKYGISKVKWTYYHRRESILYLEFSISGNFSYFGQKDVKRNKRTFLGKVSKENRTCQNDQKTNFHFWKFPKMGNYSFLYQAEVKDGSNFHFEMSFEEKVLNLENSIFRKKLESFRSTFLRLAKVRFRSILFLRLTFFQTVSKKNY